MSNKQITPLTKVQRQVIGAYTGITCGPFSEIQEYAEEVLGRPCWTHEFGGEKFMQELKAKIKPEFLKLWGSGE